MSFTSTSDFNMSEPGFDVPDYRFDQKNEMFKRAAWDESLAKWNKRFNEIPAYKDEQSGWSKTDFILRSAAWNMEWGYAKGNAHSNWGLYSWEGMTPAMKSYSSIGSDVVKDPVEMARIVKKAAVAMGAGLAGIANVNPSWVYSHEYNLSDQSHARFELPDGVKTAIVMAIPMDYDLMRNQSMILQGVTTGMGYSQMAILATQMAAFIRGLGYKAIPSGNDSALSVPLAFAAGLGEWSRMGLLITPKFGPRVRICKVFTDMPLDCDGYKPFGVVEFCKICKTCAKKCPSQAIPMGDMTTEGPNISSHSGIKKWYVDCQKCFIYWSTRRMDCTQCIRVCPFNKKDNWFHDFTRFLIRKMPVLNRPIYWGDKLFGYDKPYTVNRFWQ